MKYTKQNLRHFANAMKLMAKSSKNLQSRSLLIETAQQMEEDYTFPDFEIGQGIDEDMIISRKFID
jgi:hypothetical protein